MQTLEPMSQSAGPNLYSDGPEGQTRNIPTLLSNPNQACTHLSEDPSIQRRVLEELGGAESATPQAESQTIPPLDSGATPPPQEGCCICKYSGTAKATMTGPISRQEIGELSMAECAIQLPSRGSCRAVLIAFRFSRLVNKQSLKLRVLPLHLLNRFEKHSTIFYIFRNSGLW